MRVAVAGGSGFLGRHVTLALREAGHEVRVLARRVDPASDREGVEHRAVDVGEDLVWRGAVTMPLAARYGPAWGCLLAGAAFSIAHLTSGPPLLVIAALAMGTLWSLLAVRSRSLVPVVTSHLLWDLAVMFVRPL